MLLLNWRSISDLLGFPTSFTWTMARSYLLLWLWRWWLGIIPTVSLWRGVQELLEINGSIENSNKLVKQVLMSISRVSSLTGQRFLGRWCLCANVIWEYGSSAHQVIRQYLVSRITQSCGVLLLRCGNVRLLSSILGWVPTIDWQSMCMTTTL